MTKMLNLPIIKPMKQIILLVMFFSTLAFLGCGGGGGTSNPVSTLVAPSITSISPSSGGPGTLVTITGTGFGSFQGNSVISYSGVTLQPSSWSDTVITVQIPQNAQSNGTFQVFVGGQA